MRRPRILYLCPRHPFPPWRGDQLRAFQLLKALSARTELRLLCFAGPTEELPIDTVELRTVRSNPVSRMIGNLSVLDPATPLQVRAFLDRRMFRAVEEEVRDWHPDVVHGSLSRMAPYLLHASGCRRHLDLVDSMWLNMRTRARASIQPARAVFAGEARLCARYEAQVVRKVDSASVVAEIDRLAPGLESARVIPNGVDAQSFPYLEPVRRARIAVFFGNLGYFHNLEPARFLAIDVLDLLKRESPEARVRLAGARPGPAVRKLALRSGVELVADAPEMADQLHACAVAVLPMFSGSGMKNKVLEAFCAGTPVVANALGMAGIDAIPGEHYLLAEGPEATAASVLRLFAEPEERVRIARQARGLVLRRYSWERQAELMIDAYGLDVG